MSKQKEKRRKENRLKPHVLNILNKKINLLQKQLKKLKN
jgi:hypothetical protein